MWFPDSRVRLYSPRNSPENTGVDSLSLLQWIFLTQELNPGLLHCRQILHQLSYWGSPSSPFLWIKCQDYIIYHFLRINRLVFRIILDLQKNYKDSVLFSLGAINFTD